VAKLTDLLGDINALHLSGRATGAPNARSWPSLPATPATRSAGPRWIPKSTSSPRRPRTAATTRPWPRCSTSSSIRRRRHLPMSRNTRPGPRTRRMRRPPPGRERTDPSPARRFRARVEVTDLAADKARHASPERGTRWSKRRRDPMRGVGTRPDEAGVSGRWPQFVAH
jgi:hypothetical protein